ncbi:MAG: putative membrane protein [Candidatus Nitrosomirales archaeon]|jgi:uncharacterized membrane protein
MVTVLGWLWCVLGALVVIFGLAGLLITVNLSSIDPYGYKDWQSIIYSGIGIVLTIGITSVLIGYGLLRTKKYMWKIAVVVSLFYIALGIAAIFAIPLGWYSGIVSPTSLSAMRIFACMAAGVIPFTLLMRKSVQEYFGIHYRSKKGVVISLCVIVAIVTVPTATAFIGFAYTSGAFATHAVDDMDKISSNEQYTLSSPAGAKEWSIAADMPTPRDECGAASIESKIFVVGGYGANISTIDTVEVYDTISKTWIEGKELPVALTHAAVTSYQGKLYVVGGLNLDAKASNTLFILDPLTNEWARGQDMPTARGALTVQFVNGILYAVGGWDGTSLRVNEAYDTVTNTWASRAPMPTPRDHLASGVVDDKLYVIGGRQGNLLTNQNVNEQYDPASDKWSTKAPMPSHRAGLTAASLSDSIYVFGGENLVRAFPNNEQYIPSLDMWIGRELMPTARHGLASAEAGGNIYVICGSVIPGTLVSGKNEVFTPLDWRTISENGNP